jgi:hypothetical protein
MKVMTMGLDMFAQKTKADITAEVDFPEVEAEELHYWRKHPNLHGWMERLYRLKGGAKETFNVVNLQLTLRDLDDLEAAVTARLLPTTTGFFFGESDGSEIAEDLTFVRKARQAIRDGYAVFYSSWW